MARHRYKGKVFTVYSLFILIFFFFLLGWVFIVEHRLRCSVAWGILVPQPGLEPSSPTLEGRSLTTGPSGKSLGIPFYLLYFVPFI